MQSFYASFAKAQTVSLQAATDDDAEHAPLSPVSASAATNTATASGTVNGQNPSFQGFEGLSFESWLLAVDSSGSLQIYLQALEDSYDTVRQVVRTYSVCSEGQMLLDPQFFDDLGVMELNHQKLFRKWFLEVCGVGKVQPDATELLHDVRGHCNGHVVASGQQVHHAIPGPTVQTRSPGKGPSQGTLGDLRTLGFKEWLLHVDKSGSLLPYCEVLQENYDTVAQIVKTYSLPTKGGPVLDVQFFEDAAVASQSHQAAFLDWFAHECGVGVSSSKPQDPADVAAWLSTHHLQEYAVNLGEAGYDELLVFRVLRGNEVEEMLDVVKVVKPGHRVKFRRAIEALQAASEPQWNRQSDRSV